MEKTLQQYEETQSFFRSSRAFYFSMFLSLLCIFFQEQARLIFFRAFEDLPNHATLNLWWAVGQSIGFPLMGIISDIRVRRKILGICIACLTLSLVFLHFNWVPLAIIFYSIGAVSAVARAAFCEIHVEHIEHKLKELRAPNIIYTFLVEPLVWIIFAYSVFKSLGVFQNFSYLSTIQGLILFHVVWNYLKDSRGKAAHELTFKGIFGEIIRGKKRVVAIRGFFATFIVLVTFYFGESIWTSAQYYMDSGKKIAVIGRDLDISLGVCFFLGALVVLALRRLASKYIEIFLCLVFGGIAFTILAYYFHWRSEGQSEDVIRNMFPFVTLLGGMGLPLVYVFFGGSKKISIHLLGMIFGLIEALQNLTDISGAYFEKNFDIHNNQNYFVLILFSVFFISFILYLTVVLYKFKKKKFQDEG